MVINKGEKAYVTVNVDHTSEGIVVPRAIIRRNGKIEEIEDITGTYPLSVKDPGADGTCYVCWVKGKRTLLNYCMGRWYLEEQPECVN